MIFKYRNYFDKYYCFTWALVSEIERQSKLYNSVNGIVVMAYHNHKNKFSRRIQNKLELKLDNILHKYSNNVA